MDYESNHFQPTNTNRGQQETQNQDFQIDFNQDFSLIDTDQQCNPLQTNDENNNGIVDNFDEDLNFELDLFDNNSKTNPTAYPMDNYPRFSDIQMSFQIMRKAIPQIFSSETIDNLYEIIVKKSMGSSSKSSEVVFDNNNEISFDENQHKETKGFKNKITSKTDSRFQITNGSQVNFGVSKLNFSQDEIPFNNKNQKISNHERTSSHRSQLKISNQLTTKKYKQFDPKENETAIEMKNNKNQNKQRTVVTRDEQKSQGINLSQQLQKIWGPQMQDLLIDLYQKGNKFSFIKNEFRERFPEHASLFTVDTIRIKFKKIIRTSIRLLQQNSQSLSQYKLPQLMKINNEIISIVVHHGEAMPLRLALLQIYVRERCDISLIRGTIIKINQFFRYHHHKQER